MVDHRHQAVIVDVDGTLVNVSTVLHYILRPKGEKDFDKFHAASAFCPPIPATIALLKLLPRSTRIIVVTARRQHWEYETRGWLNQWIRYDALHMRADDDYRTDVEVKRDILATLRDRYDIALAIDDNPKVIALWESEGIPTITIPGWDHPTPAALAASTTSEGAPS